MEVLSVLGLFRGANLSGWDPQRHKLAQYSIPIGTQALHAVGYAIGAKWDGAEVCAVAYFGDGATSEGDVSEAFNFAAVHTAPVVFFCQNHQWAISVPLGKKMSAPVYRRAFGFGFPGVQVDGNDVLAVYAVTRAAAERAREGGGPTLIEAITYRLGAHTTTDDPTRYRTSDELDMWKAREPIGRYRAFLERTGLWSEELERDVQADADRGEGAGRAGRSAATGRSWSGPGCGPRSWSATSRPRPTGWRARSARRSRACPIRPCPTWATTSTPTRPPPSWPR